MSTGCKLVGRSRQGGTEGESPCDFYRVSPIQHSRRLAARHTKMRNQRTRRTANERISRVLIEPTSSPLHDGRAVPSIAKGLFLRSTRHEHPNRASVLNRRTTGPDRFRSPLQLSNTHQKRLTFHKNHVERPNQANHPVLELNAQSSTLLRSPPKRSKESPSRSLSPDPQNQKRGILAAFSCLPLRSSTEPGSPGATGKLGVRTEREARSPWRNSRTLWLAPWSVAPLLDSTALLHGNGLFSR